ncbi:MAG TPA: polysaccharide pyruvyl transferase family protein [Bryobacteraceae bacterium]
MIFLAGSYGFGGIGDEAILSTLLAQFRARRPDLRMVVASGNPEGTTAAHGVEAVAWDDMAAIHRAVQISDLVVIGGGGLFHDCGGVDPDNFLTGQDCGIARFAGPALLATLYQKPLMLYAVGVGPLDSAHGLKFTRLAAQAAAAITVRDQASNALLQNLGIPARKITVTADPSFAFRPTLLSSLQHSVNPGFVLRRPILAVAPRHWTAGVHPDFLERELATALDLFLQQTGGTVVMIPFQTPLQADGGEADQDRAVAERILAHMRFREKATTIEGPATPDQTFCRLRDCDLVLGMRLHALIFAASAGVPAVALRYRALDELVKRLGMDEFSIDVKDIDGPRLASLLVGALNRGDELRKTMSRAAGEQQKAEQDNAGVALDLVEAPPLEPHLSLESFDLLARSLYAGAQFGRQSREIAQAAATEAARFAEDRTTLLDEQKTVDQQLAEVTGRAHTLEEENRAISQKLAEVRGQWHTAEEENRTLTQKLGDIQARSRTVEEARSALQTMVAELRIQVQKTLEGRQAAESFFATRLQEMEQARASVVMELDRYGALFQKDLAVYRSQRAWKAMLICRKAYSLLARSFAQFAAWAMGLLFGRAGALAEYELKFPDIANYIPDTFRRPWIEKTPDNKPPDAQSPSASSTLSDADSGGNTPDTPPQGNQYDVVILAIIDFDFRFQRPQQIAAEFARQGHRVFWISPTRFLPVSSAQPYEVLPLRENLWEIHLRSRQPDIYMGDLQADHIESMVAALAHLYRDWGIAEHTILAQLPFWRQLTLKLRAAHGSKILYDCMDDWETFENMGAFNVSEEKHLVNECDVLVVTGAELQRKFRAQGLNPLLARNGADFPFFAKARETGLLAEYPKPIVGYFGAIADWIDLDLVYEVAKSRPQYTFVLIGQVFGRDTAQLEALPNVHLLGNKPYADIPAYLYHFDACTIPFLINQVTKATDPVKLYEYFSLGKPVVATNMAELSQCGDLVYIGHDADDFARKLDLAVSEKEPDLPRRRIEFAKANTWSSRVEDIDRAVRKTFPLVSILIVTHNSSPYVRPCLESIRRNTSYPSYEVLLVDNASTDDTPALLKEYASRDDRLRVFSLPQNLGFAGGNNHAARQSRGEHLIFLNIDTMVTSGWIDRLLGHVRQDPSIGLLCPVTNFAGNEIKINVNYTAWQGMERFARRLTGARSGHRFEIGVAPLYCALMPRTLWDQVGEMDTRYEIGMFEDDDLSLRVREAGFGVFAAEDCFIHHFGQGSFSKLSSDTYNRIFEANRKRFEEKWKRPWVAHKTRPGVRPAYEEKRFDPVEFTGNGAGS